MDTILSRFFFFFKKKQPRNGESNEIYFLRFKEYFLVSNILLGYKSEFLNSMEAMILFLC